MEKKARKQFKGLFDKRPGEIAEVETGSTEEQCLDEEDDEQVKLGKQSQANDAANQDGNGEVRRAVEVDRKGLFSNLRPSVRGFFRALGFPKWSVVMLGMILLLATQLALVFFGQGGGFRLG